MARYRVLSLGELEVVCLLTTITESFHRISMHGVREELLDLQAKSASLSMDYHLRIQILDKQPAETQDDVIDKIRHLIERFDQRSTTIYQVSNMCLYQMR